MDVMIEIADIVMYKGKLLHVWEAPWPRGCCPPLYNRRFQVVRNTACGHPAAVQQKQEYDLSWEVTEWEDMVWLCSPQAVPCAQ